MGCHAHITSMSDSCSTDVLFAVSCYNFSEITCVVVSYPYPYSWQCLCVCLILSLSMCSLSVLLLDMIFPCLITWQVWNLNATNGIFYQICLKMLINLRTLILFRSVWFKWISINLLLNLIFLPTGRSVFIDRVDSEGPHELCWIKPLLYVPKCLESCIWGIFYDKLKAWKMKWN